MYVLNRSIKIGDKTIPAGTHIFDGWIIPTNDAENTLYVSFQDIRKVKNPDVFSEFCLARYNYYSVWIHRDLIARAEMWLKFNKVKTMSVLKNLEWS